MNIKWMLYCLAVFHGVFFLSCSHSTWNLDFYFSSDSLSLIEARCFSSADTATGTRVIFNERNFPVVIVQYLQNKQHGLLLEISQDQKLQYMGGYNLGEPHGMSLSFHVNGQIEKIVLYDNGRLMRTVDCRDIDGKRLNAGDVVDGDGELIVYNSHGEVVERGPYVNGYRNGYWQRFLNDSSFTEEFYQDGFYVLNGQKVYREYY